MYVHVCAHVCAYVCKYVCVRSCVLNVQMRMLVPIQNYVVKKLKLCATCRVNYVLKISKYAQKLCANSNKNSQFSINIFLRLFRKLFSLKWLRTKKGPHLFLW